MPVDGKSTYRPSDPVSKGLTQRSPGARRAVQGTISEASKDKYLFAPGNDAAKKRMVELLSVNPQDLTRAYFELPEKPALPRLREIPIPTLVLVGDADIPDVHAHAGAIEAGMPRARRVVVKDVGHIMISRSPRSSAGW
jgi:3-oxoadipate enol-lactonase